MWSAEDLSAEIAELFEEAQLLVGKHKRFRIKVFLRPSLGQWPPPQLTPNGKHICDACGYSAHTFQQLNSHRYGHSKRVA